jgi:hypothetical protein
MAQFGAPLCIPELREDSMLIVSSTVDLARTPISEDGARKRRGEKQATPIRMACRRSEQDWSLGEPARIPPSAEGRR